MVSSSVCSNDGACSSIKFVCSYGGKILPRQTDGKLRYVGGETRVLAVDRSILFSELLVKLGELCGSSVSLRCQFPMEDLDALVSITSDEDLSNLIEEYDRASQDTSSSIKIKAFLSLPKSIKKVSTPPLVTSPSAVRLDRSIHTGTVPDRCVHQMSKPLNFPVYFQRSTGSELPPYAYIPRRNPSYICYGNHWQ